MNFDSDDDLIDSEHLDPEEYDDGGYITKIGGLIDIKTGEFKGMVVEYSIDIIEDALPVELYMLTVLRLVDLPENLPIPKLPPDVEYDFDECYEMFVETFPDVDPEDFILDDDTCRELLSEEGMYDHLELYPHIDLIPLLDIPTIIHNELSELISMVKRIVREKIEGSTDPSFTRSDLF